MVVKLGFYRVWLVAFEESVVVCCHSFFVHS